MYVVPPQTTLFTPEYALLHYACVSFTYNNKMKIHDSLKNYRNPILTKKADADKPARRVWRPVKVTKHGTFYMFGTVSY